MKFVLFVEGQTERNSAAEFLKRWIDPQLNNRVGIQVVRFNGYAELARQMATKAQMYLTGPQNHEIIAVIGLLDLYGPDFYPIEMTTAEDRYNWGKDHFENIVNDTRFRMHFAVHEFEAWLLSDPGVFSREVREALPAKVNRPESVNFNEPPAKLLDRIYNQVTRRSYKKTTYGKQLFAKLDPAVAKTKCPYLSLMLEDLLALAKNAGL